MKLISVNLPDAYIKVLEMLVLEGKFPNRSEAIRVGIRDLIKTEYLLDESVKRKMKVDPIEVEIEEDLSEKLTF
jgi:Arc/MetJ-type ribon-helix-helix transcriptional regulator